jgi:flagellin-like protein
MMKSLGGVGMTRRITKLRRHVKALSPIFAVLILIAIAVIAGIIVYMFTSGYLGTMMGGGSAGQEKVAIESVQVISNSSITLWAKSTGGGDVDVTEVILRDLHGNQVGAPDTVAVTLLSDGTLTAVTATVTLTPGTVYTAALVTKVGNQFVSPSFKG